MPQMGGKQLREQLANAFPNMRVLYTSGFTDDAIAHHRVLDKGINFLQKPFRIEELALKVRQVLDAPVDESCGKGIRK
jgi:FixJ family two-component response regulator